MLLHVFKNKKKIYIFPKIALQKEPFFWYIKHISLMILLFFYTSKILNSGLSIAVQYL